MADIRLAKPAAGTTQTVPSAPDGRFIFDFPADAATLTRNGDDLVLTFEDGAAIQLQGFYTTYSKEEMPSFQVDGVEISGQDFFAALDEDLMPAAGPASGSSAARGGRYNEYGGSDLLDGLDHLGRLDIGFDGGTQLATDTVEPSPYSEVDHGVTVTPSTPGTDPDDPSIPVQGEDFPPTMPHDVLQVDESALDGGSGGGSATAAGSMRVSAPDGVAIITIGGVVVWQNGALTGNPVLTDEGHLDVTGFDGTNLTYTYTLTGSTQEHTKLNAGGENDAIAHEMAVVVTDTDGDSGSAVIRVEITDDVPTIESFEKTVTEGDADPIVGNALEGAVAGADGANFAWTNPDQQGRYGKLTLNEDGTYSYELNNDDPEVKALTDGDTRTEEISYTYTDADGDVATGKVTITINGVNNGVEVGSGTLTVYEAGLADGSQAGQAAAPTTAEGSLTVNAPDGVKDIRIDGVTVFENGALTGNTVSTDEGTLTVTGFDEATGELKFTYELTGNTLEHNTDATDKQLSHDLAVTVTDVDGSTDTGVVTVVITDDGPVVTPVETEYKGNKYVNTVSVSFGADNDTGTDSSLAVNAHDVDGTVIEWIKVDDSTSSGTDLSKLSQGESWTNGNIIVSRENGNFVFKIKENGSNAHITVTATDADGDTDTEELNLTAPDAGPNAIIVDEALLTDGNVVNSDNSGHKPSGTGSFTVNLNGEDGTVTLNYGTGENSSITLSLINGETFDKDWLSTNKTLTVNGVVVEVTGATQQDGSWKIEYSYSLTGQQTHTGQGVGENDALSDEIDITVTDATGDTSTGSLTVTVHDDGPVLTLTDANVSAQYGESVVIGTLTSEYGADGAHATNGLELSINEVKGELFNGVYTFAGIGTATIDGEGKISFTPELSSGGQKDYTLSVTITDADGDKSSDEFEFSVEGTQVSINDVTLTTHDAKTEGSASDTASTTVTLPAGATLVAGSYDVLNGEGGEPIGTLTVSEDGTITFVQDENYTAGTQGDDKAATDTVHTAHINVTLADGTVVENAFDVTVNIVDDVPVVTLTDANVNAQYGESVVIGTLTSEYGADGAHATNGLELSINEVKGELFNGVYTFAGIGTATIDGEGKISFTPELSSGGQKDYTLSVTITDADGDKSSDEFEFSVEGTQVSINDVTLTTHDAKTEGSASDTASTTVTLPAGATLVAGSYDVLNGEGGEPIGTLTVSEDGTITFVQDENYTAGTQGDDKAATDTVHTAHINVTLADGTVVENAFSVTVTIVDDVPTISIDTEASGAYGSTVTGSVDIDFGADGADGEKAVTVSLNDETVTGAKGEDGNYTFTFKDGSKLTLNGETGDFSYNGVPASGVGTSYKFTFTVTDADGDTATATTTAEILPKASYTGTVSSFDNDLLQESSPSHPVEVSGMPGIKQISDGAKVFQGETLIGEFTLSGNKLFFQQSAAYSHEKGSDSVTLSHQLTVTDEYGKEHIVAVDITIGDSDPYAHNDTFELKKRGEDGKYDAEGNVLDNDTRSADSPTLVTEVEGTTINGGEGFTEIEGQFGTLYIKADGTYHYVLDEKVTIPENSIKREEFTYTITDADGDTSTAAALTILVGKGTVHVKEPGIGVNENGEEIAVNGNDTATGQVEGAVTRVEFGSTQYSGDIPAEYELKCEATVVNSDTITIHTNYGDLVVNKTTGEYEFKLDDDTANPLPNGFEIHQGFNFTTTVDGVTTSQEVVVVIEGTNDEGRLHEAGEGGHHNANLWIDAKAEGADSIEKPYDAKNHPNLGKTDSGDHSSDFNQQSGGTARPTAWLPFTLEDPDFGDSLTFKAVYTGVNNSASGTSSMQGSDFVSYVGLLEGIASDPLSVALSVEWGKFQQNFSAEQLGKMQFYRNDYGIFAITSDAVDLETLTHQDGAQYWLTFLVDSDADVIRHMAEGVNNASNNGKILHFSFQVTDKTGNTVKTQTGNGTFANTNNVLVHVYGSNDTPEIRLEEGKLVVHDDDVNRFENNADTESHSITINYNGQNYTGELHDGQMTLRKGDASITFSVSSTTDNGTQFTINKFMMGDTALTGTLVITVTDARGNSAIYHAQVKDGQLTQVTEAITQDGTDESENLYGGSGNDTLTAGGGNDSLWGGAGDDQLYGQGGNDRLYGEAGNDTLQGGDGLDILVGGDGSDSLDGGAGNDVLIGDGQGELQSVIEGTVNAETFRDFLDLKSPEVLESYMSKFETENDGNDTLEGGDGDDMLFGMGGDDQLFGGAGDDILIGGSGNDYLDGGEGRDTIYAGDGNDIIVYDQQDYLVSGGSGIDFMVSDDSTLSLTKLLQGTGDGNGPIVDSIEVLITGTDALSLTSLEQMATDYGISITGSSLKLNDDLWTQDGNGYRFTGGQDDGGELFLQVNSQTDAQVSVELVPSDDIAEAVQRAEIEHSNG